MTPESLVQRIAEDVHAALFGERKGVRYDAIKNAIHAHLSANGGAVAWVDKLAEGAMLITKPPVHGEWIPLALAALAAQGEAVAPDIKQVMEFYDVSDLTALARIQADHVERLQAKMPKLRDENPRNPRSGGA